MATIGWIGLGNMGKPMTANLVKAGHTVTGFDLNPDAVAAAADNGVKPAGSLADAVRGADIVFTMLPKGEHARAVYLGDDGVFALASTATLLIDSSTIDVATAQALHDEAASAGFRFLDAPVSGGISGAAAGTLAFMIGGDAATVAAARPVIEVMAGNIVHTGGDGMGQAAKIVNNMLALINTQGIAEGAVLANRFGLDPKVFWDVASVASGNSWALRTWFPVPGVVESAAANKNFDATFSAELAHKDVGLAMAGAQDHGLTLPAATVAYEGLARLLDEGWGGKDCTLLIRNIDPEADGVPTER